MRDVGIFGECCSQYVHRLGGDKLRCTVQIGRFVVDVPAVDGLLSAFVTLARCALYGGDEVLGGVAEEGLPFTGVNRVALNLDGFDETLFQKFAKLRIRPELHNLVNAILVRAEVDYESRSTLAVRNIRNRRSRLVPKAVFPAHGSAPVIDIAVRRGILNVRSSGGVCYD